MADLAEVRDSAGNLDPQQAMAELTAQRREAGAANPNDAVSAREYRLTLMAMSAAVGDGR